MLKISEIFHSINGEVNGFHQGRPALFIRLYSCNLCCGYCDARYAANEIEGGYFQRDVRELFSELKKNRRNEIITITGGEPFLQHEIHNLIPKLVFGGFRIAIETNGTMEIPFDYFQSDRISLVIDYKLQYPERMIESNFRNCGVLDWIKVPISSVEEIPLAVELRQRFNGNMAFTCTKQELYPIVVQTVIDCGLDVVINRQIHKDIWPSEVRGK